MLSVVKVNANVQEDRSFPGMYAVRSLAMKYSRVAWTHMSAAASCMCVLSCRKFLLANLCTSTLRLHSKAVEYSLPYTPPHAWVSRRGSGISGGGGVTRIPALPTDCNNNDLQEKGKILSQTCAWNSFNPARQPNFYNTKYQVPGKRSGNYVYAVQQFLGFRSNRVGIGVRVGVYLE